MTFVDWWLNKMTDATQGRHTVRRTDPEKDHLRAEINLLRASMHNAVQTHFVKCNQCGVYREDGLICWNCMEDE